MKNRKRKRSSSNEPVATCNYNLFVGTATGSFKGVSVCKNGHETIAVTKNLVKTKENLSNKNEIKCLNWSNELQDEILIGAKENVLVFNTTTEEFNNKLPIPSGECSGIFKLNDIVYISSTVGTILSSKLHSSEPLWTECINVHKKVYRMKHSPYKENIIATGGEDNDLKLWDLNTSQISFNAKNIKPDELQLQAPVWVSDISFCSGSDKVVTCMRTGYVRLFDPLLSQRRPIFNAHVADQAFSCVSVTSRDSQFIVGSGTGELHLVDTRGKTPFIGKYKGCCGAVKSVVCPVDQSLVCSVSLDRHFRIHDFNTRKLLFKDYMQSRLTTLLPRYPFVLKEMKHEARDDEVEEEDL